MANDGRRWVVACVLAETIGMTARGNDPVGVVADRLRRGARRGDRRGDRRRCRDGAGGGDGPMPPVAVE